MTRAEYRGCADLARAAGEGLAGTAPRARAWVAVEQPGPFGPDALLDSRLPAEIGNWLRAQVANSNIKVVLVRRTLLPSHVATKSHRAVEDGGMGAGGAHPRRVWWSWPDPKPTLHELTFTDPAQLPDLDIAALGSGRPDEVHPRARLRRDPLLLLCTNGRRDACCAALGRPVARELARDVRYRDSVMESSHLGGHRFAPGAIQLPQGWAHGRLDIGSAKAVLEAAGAGRVHLDTARGRCELPSMGQVAELAVRREAGLDRFDAVSVTEPGRSGEDSGEWTVTAVDGRTWLAGVRAVPGPVRPESCGADPVPMTSFDVALNQQS